MKILITGGAGFIGSHLAEEYLKNNFKVYILDKKPKSSLITSIQSKVQYIEFDLINNGLDEIFTKIKPDIVNHHAALVNVNQSLKNPIEYSKNNISATLKLLELSKKNQIKQFIFASSSAVYGETCNFPIKESSLTLPISIYGSNKLCCEFYINLFSKYFKTTIFRYANVYGPGQDSSAEGGVISIFANNFKINKKSIIYDNGKQTRDFIYVKDIAKANLIAANKQQNGIFNISTNQKISIYSIFKLFCKISKKDLKPLYNPKRKGDIKKSLLDNSLAIKILHWKPEMNINNGLTETYKSFNN